MCTLTNPSDDTNTTETTNLHIKYHSVHSDSPTATTAHRSTLSPQAAMLLKLSKRARNNVAHQQYKSGTLESSTSETSPSSMVSSEADIEGAHELKKVKSSHYSQFRYQPMEGQISV